MDAALGGKPWPSQSQPSHNDIRRRAANQWNRATKWSLLRWRPAAHHWIRAAHCAPDPCETRGPMEGVAWPVLHRWPTDTEPIGHDPQALPNRSFRRGRRLMARAHGGTPGRARDKRHHRAHLDPQPPGWFIGPWSKDSIRSHKTNPADSLRCRQADVVHAHHRAPRWPAVVTISPPNNKGSMNASIAE